MGAFSFSVSGGGGSGSPGGSSPQIQFNNSGAFGGTTNLEFDSANATLRGLTGLTGGFRLFNTADITTNVEVFRINWASNVLNLGTDNAGTGTIRELRMGTYAAGVLQNAVRIFNSGGTPFVTFTNAGSSNTAFVGWNFVHGALTAASGSQTMMSITGTVNTSGTCGYNATLIDITETTTGSGVNNLLVGRIGGSNRFRFDRTGGLTMSQPATDGFSYFNTADEVTNRELFRLQWASNVLQMLVSQTGTGSIREVRVGNTSNFLRIFAPTAGTQFEMQGSSSSVVAANGVFRTGVTSTASSGAHVFNQLAGVVNQSATAGYTLLDLAATETATGSGTKKMLDCRVGGTTNFSILNNGRIQYVSGNTGTTVGAAGGASALPATPTGYLLIDIGGTTFKVPYYAN